MNIPTKENQKLAKILEKVNNNVKIQTFFECSNVTAIKRAQITDHGPIHFTIVANIALKILRNITETGVSPSIVKDYNMTNDDAEVVVFLASVLHDTGMIVHREGHHQMSITIAYPLIQELLEGIYDERQKAIMTAETLNAIFCHEKEAKIYTLEAGIVRVADALDMKQGRARIPFNEGVMDIHSVSALSIEEVEIKSTPEKPVVIQITMTNSAGIFQVDHLLRNKLKNSGLDKYVSVIAEVKSGAEKQIVHKYEIN